MKIAAIIGEFNPFHNGHRLIIEKARELGADRVITLMSGDYVQRGVPAITDRHVRAHMALVGGADAVLSYPTRFASSTAESFAFHAVEMLNLLGCVDMLVFGSECGDLELLDRCADVLVNESEAYKAKLKEGLRKGLSFPKARAEALPEYAEVLSTPNNILAVEYLKALKKIRAKMVPCTVTREGMSYLDDSKLTEMASASALRRALAEADGENFPGVEISMPEECVKILKNDVGKYGITRANDYSLLLIDRLWTVGEPFLLNKFTEMTDDLANTIIKKRNLFTTVDDFADRCKTKNITLSHIYRAFMHVILDFRMDPRMENPNAYYTQMLGFRTESEDVVRAIQENTRIPVIMNPPREVDGLNPDQRRLFDEEMRVSNLYESVRADKYHKPFENVFTKELIKV
ncbi:MAG: nucleotidyltransferase family protein [Lachnospiraceae bacterium]|nr:nucleotidyltransferase family protein [Lachnospiraceae bacterium]